MTAGTAAVPAFWVEASASRRVPVVVSLYMVDAAGVARLTPAVERAIDRTVEITGRQGLATATVLNESNAEMAAGRALERAMVMSDVIVLFRCQSVEVSERLMNHLSDAYTLTLLREA